MKTVSSHLEDVRPLFDQISIGVVETYSHPVYYQSSLDELLQRQTKTAIDFILSIVSGIIRVRLWKFCYLNKPPLTT